MKRTLLVMVVGWVMVMLTLFLGVVLITNAYEYYDVVSVKTQQAVDEADKRMHVEGWAPVENTTWFRRPRLRLGW